MMRKNYEHHFQWFDVDSNKKTVEPRTRLIRYEYQVLFALLVMNFSTMKSVQNNESVDSSFAL